MRILFYETTQMKGDHYTQELHIYEDLIKL